MMSAPVSPPSPLLRHLRLSDLSAAVQLATQATTGIIDITEGVHQSVRATLGLPAGAAHGRTGGLTGYIYRGIRSVTQGVGHGLDATLGVLLKQMQDPRAPLDATPEREVALSILNGVLGDRLQAGGNPLALGMALRQGGRALPVDDAAALAAQLQGAGPRLLLLIHGLCMSDTQWRREGHDHGAWLAQHAGYTPVYVRYNTGLHTSLNGQQLAGLLEALVAHWPVELQEIAVLAHSMGGLVARSAQHQALQAGYQWPARLRHLVFLGTPHHGAPLERAGHGVDLLLGSTPYTAPFVRLGQLRSAGITDLRHGHVLDADWHGRGRFDTAQDHRIPLPLPPGVACYTVAAALAGQRSALAERLTGDGLVPLRSALGEHAEARHALAFDAAHRQVVWRTGHLALLNSPEVAEQLRVWLSPSAS